MATHTVHAPKDTGTGETIHVGLVGVHTLCSMAALVFSIVFLVGALAVNCSPDNCQSMLFITTAFTNIRQIESNTGWPVATERIATGDSVQQLVSPDGVSNPNYPFSHYYECMHSARIADTTCNFPDSFSDYLRCITNTTASPLKTALDSCRIMPTSGSGYAHYMTSEEYMTCLYGQQILRNSVSMRASRNVFRSCLARVQWPTVEWQMDLDSSLFLGSFNWAIFLSVGFAVMTSFGVYSMSWKEDGPVHHGEPTYFMRLGLFWSWVAWLWNLAFFIIFILVAFRETGSFETNGGLPTTVSTTLVTLGVLALVLVYFGNELFKESQWEFLTHVLEGTGVHKITKHKYYKKLINKMYSPLVDPHAGRADLGANLPGATRSYEISDADVAKYYTPPLLTTWADGYIADGLIVLGIAGVSQQLNVDQAWNIFVLIGVYRLLNMMIARFLYECFMNNFSLEDDVNKGKFKITPAFMNIGDPLRHKDPHLSIRVMALSTQIAAIYLFIAFIMVAFDGNYVLSEFLIFRLFVIFGFIVPEAIRILLHVYCQVWYVTGKASSWLLLNTHMFVWNWDICVRLIVIALIMIGTDGNARGTREYLQVQSNTLMRDYLRFFSY